MSNNAPINQTPYLRVQREFPETDLGQLAFQSNLAYVDVANAINVRTIGIFPTTRPAVTGESYYLNSPEKQQTLRKVFTFSSTANITHNINLSNVQFFTKMYGQFTDGTNWYGLIPATSNAIANQTSFYITSTSIVFIPNGATPALTSGIIVLEWLSFR